VTNTGQFHRAVANLFRIHIELPSLQTAPPESSRLGSPRPARSSPQQFRLTLSRARVSVARSGGRALFPSQPHWHRWPCKRVGAGNSPCAPALSARSTAPDIVHQSLKPSPPALAVAQFTGNRRGALDLVRRKQPAWSGRGRASFADCLRTLEPAPSGKGPVGCNLSTVLARYREGRPPVAPGAGPASA